MSSIWVIYFIVLCGGFLISAPFWIHAGWLTKPANLTLGRDRLGVDIRTADSRTLVVVLGVLLLVGAGHFLYRSDQAAKERYDSQKEELEKTEEKLRELYNEIQNRKEKYDLDLVPVFEGMHREALDPGRVRFTGTFKAYRGEKFQVEHKELESGENKALTRIEWHQLSGPKVNIKQIGRDDWLELVAESDAEEWKAEVNPALQNLCFRKIR